LIKSIDFKQTKIMVTVYVLTNQFVWSRLAIEFLFIKERDPNVSQVHNGVTC